MFSYCKRSNYDRNFTHMPFEYHTSPMLTTKGFGEPRVCANINVPFVHNRGIPGNLIDLETRMRGQDRGVQPYCNSYLGKEAEDIQFSTFRDIDLPRPKGPIPCAPVPIVQMKAYDTNMCNHVKGNDPCGHSCACSPRCQCKEVWRGMNKLGRPYIPPLSFRGA
jgi:hypothetical protein